MGRSGRVIPLRSKGVREFGVTNRIRVWETVLKTLRTNTMQRATSLPTSVYQSAALQLLLEAHPHIRIPQPEQGATYEAVKIDRAKSAPVGPSTTKRCLEAPPQGTYPEGIEVTPASSKLELFDILTVVDTGLLILCKYLTAEHRAALACTCALGKEVTATEIFRKNLLFADCLKMTDDVFENLVIFRGFVFAGRHLAFSNLMDMSTGGNSEANKGSVVVEGVDAPGGSLVVVRAGALPVGTLEVYWPGGRRGRRGARVGAAVGAYRVLEEQGGRGLRAAQIGVAVKGDLCYGVEANLGFRLGCADGSVMRFVKSREACKVGGLGKAEAVVAESKGTPWGFCSVIVPIRVGLLAQSAAWLGGFAQVWGDMRDSFPTVTGGCEDLGTESDLPYIRLLQAAMQKVTEAMGEIDEARGVEKHLPPQVSTADVIKKLRVITAVHESVPNGYMPLSSPPLIGSGWLVHWGSHIFLGSTRLPGGLELAGNWFSSIHYKLQRVLFEVAKSAFPLASALPDDFAGHLAYSPNYCPDVTVLDAEGPGRHVIFDVAAAQPMADAHPWGGHDGRGSGSKARGGEQGGDKTQRWFGGRRYMSEDEAKEEEGGEEEDEGETWQAGGVEGEGVADTRPAQVFVGASGPGQSASCVQDILEEWEASVCLGFLKRLLDVGED
ncbi:hypothetical protein CYMTET_13689 [Cymbomonas tetramitiformis]|uniref:Uncharacterized protein n=1 Tax=Cymbomonas tetramitiformis TaxID=36881 RepID=A0AAE0GHV3_9CHLO|nr:hypothetical protein CYMTET_13689 [Cymbomonas tetramitiformis]